MTSQNNHPTDVPEIPFRNTNPNTSTASFITLTGADEWTDIGELAQLECEVGLLYTFCPEGRPRYFSQHWICETARKLPRAALHVCGLTAQRQLIAGQLDDLVASVMRVQVNGLLTTRDCKLICAQYPTKTIITQHTPHNLHLLAVSAPNHALLVDASGGRGLTLAAWEAPVTTKAVGYAGGLGPDNLARELTRLRPLLSGHWWVDMESSLRVDDRFSLERARACVAVFHQSLPTAQP